MAERHGWLLAGASLLLLASLAQFHLLARDWRLLPDEAHFMTFARDAAVKGQWLLPGSLDKPPLSIYASALSMTAFGVVADDAGVLQLDPRIGEFTGRLPNALLAILLTALLTRLAGRLYRCRRAAFLAGLLSAGSPFALAFGPSAFTDMSMLFWSAAALLLALEARWTAAGLALGLAFWCKQQAALVAILPLAIILCSAVKGRDKARFCLALGVALGALPLWDGARPEASVFLQAAANNAPDQLLATAATWGDRLRFWLERSVWLLGPPVVSALVLAFGLATAIARRVVRRSRRIRRWELALGCFIGAYLAAHALFAFNLYPRYLLPLLLPLALLAAGALAQSRSAFFIALVALLLGLAWSLNADLKLAGDRREQTGIDLLARHLGAKPVATVIYDPWLGWELGYYLGPWHDKRRVHYPTAAQLAAGALALDELGPRFFVAPVAQPHEAWLATLAAAGFALNLDYASQSYHVYRLLPPSQPRPPEIGA